MQKIVILLVIVVLCVRFLKGHNTEMVCGRAPAHQAPPETHHERFKRIIGGETTEYGEFPWMIHIYENRERKCGGTLIHEKWVLSAAHCFMPALNGNVDFEDYEYAAKAGDYNVDTIDEYEQTRVAIDFFMFPEYHGGSYSNDIALLEMDRPFDLNGYVLPACLPRYDETVYPFTKCEVTGWGWISDTEMATTLQKLTVPVLPHKYCESINIPLIDESPRLVASMMCAGYIDGKRDSCKGDSGGPLLCHRYGSGTDGEIVVAGIVSWGRGCAKAGYTGVYTEVSPFGEWINQTLALPPKYNSDPCKYSGIRLNETSGWINSPGFLDGESYESNLECTWEVDITSLRPQPVQLNITFEAVDLEGVGNNGGWVLSGSSTIGDCRNDFLNIFVGSNFQEQIGNYCGSELPPSIVLSNAEVVKGRLRFVFDTDYLTNLKGFNLFYAFTY